LVIAFAVTTPSGGWQFAFPLAAMIVIYVFSFDQGAVSTLLRCSALQKLGLWSYSIYMIHTFIFHVMKMAATFIAQKAKLDLVTWHNDEKLMLLGTPDQALLPALILSVVLVVPVAALTYRWIEKPAMDAARRGVSTTRRPVLRWRARPLVLSARVSIGLGLAAVRASARAGMAHLRM
jgi:peptidoglycan/LPS O-acetylase OafA/YrhL